MARFFRKRRRADLQHQLLSVYGLGSIVCETRTAKLPPVTCMQSCYRLQRTSVDVYLLRCGLHVRMPDDLHFSRPRSSRERSANATELRKAIVTDVSELHVHVVATSIDVTHVTSRFYKLPPFKVWGAVAHTYLFFFSGRGVNGIAKTINPSIAQDRRRAELHGAMSFVSL